MSTLRVIFTFPHLKVAGGSRIFLSYADRLSRLGHAVTVVVEYPSPLRRAAAAVFGSDVPTWIARDFRPAIVRVAKVTPATLPAADIVIAGTSRHALACRGAQGLVHMVQHDDGLYQDPRELADTAYRLPCPKIAVSTWVRDVLVARGAGGPVEVLLNPTDRQQFSFVPEARPASGVRVLMLDHPYAWKGTAEGFRAFAAARQRAPGLRLVLFSARNKRPTVACDEFHALPPQQALARLYSSCHVYLCPSWHEGSGLPSMEAMHCHAALVTYDNGGSADFAFDGKTALVAPSRNEALLAEKLACVAEDAALRERIAEAGTGFVRSMPDWDTQAARFAAILGRLCS